MKRTQTAALLDNPQLPKTYKITMRLQEGKTARFEYNDRFIAREHYEQLRGVGVLAGLVIKEIEFEESTGG